MPGSAGTFLPPVYPGAHSFSDRGAVRIAVIRSGARSLESERDIRERGEYREKPKTELSTRVRAKQRSWSRRRRRRSCGRGLALGWRIRSIREEEEQEEEEEDRCRRRWLADFRRFVRVSRALPTLEFLGTKREEVRERSRNSPFGGNKGTAVVPRRAASSRVEQRRAASSREIGAKREETRNDRSLAPRSPGTRDYRPVPADWSSRFSPNRG